MKKNLLLAISIAFLSCNKNAPESLSIGVWRAELQLNDANVLPFNFEVTSNQSLKIFNAEEIILVDEIIYKNDSIYIQMPVFEGYIAGKLSPNKIEGSFIKESLDRVVPFEAKLSKEPRFKIKKVESNHEITGNWEAIFSEGVEEDEYVAKGIFNQKGQNVTGTFRTTTGDYRYLEGVIDGDQLMLSTFDGSHAFLFKATLKDNTMHGQFYSGSHWEEPFVAKRNEAYELPNENELTFLKAGYDALEFTFPNASGEMISLSDAQFKNKVVVVQIMGTWCPNCLDESKFYSEYYNENKNKNLAFVALAFEYAKSEALAFKSIKRLKERIGIDYPILLAQFGTSNKLKAQEKLPMLNQVLSYPTSVFIDKTGKVRKIHTGFNGPATGEKYTAFKKEFKSFISALQSE
ncbi:redoxin [Flavobacteriales bacterium 34_180_T64]|nr:redoxin [Flavobacteriales bacterium 34_180_T64]